MKVADIVRMGAEMLKFLSKNEVKVSDWQYVPMYERFEEMRAEGIKYSVAVDELADEYGMSRATVERALKRFRKRCD